MHPFLLLLTRISIKLVLRGFAIFVIAIPKFIQDTWLN